MQRCASASNAGSGTIVEGPSRSNLRIVMRMAGVLVADDDAKKLLESIWSGISESGPDRILKGLLEGSAYVAAASLVGIAMRRSWSWISIQSISSGSVSYSVTVPASQIDELKGIVKSGKMVDQLNEYLKNPKALLESFNVSKTDVDKAVETLPGNVNLLKVELSEHGDVKEESKEKLNVDDSSSTAKGEIVANKVSETAKIKNEDHMVVVVPPPGTNPALVAALLVDKGADANIKHVGGYCFVGAVPSADQLKALKQLKPKDLDTILLDVMGGGLAFRQRFNLSDRVNTVIVALKNKYGKDYVLKVVDGKEYLRKEKRLRDIGIANDPVLVAELVGNQE